MYTTKSSHTHHRAQLQDLRFDAGFNSFDPSLCQRTLFMAVWYASWGSPRLSRQLVLVHE